jgi:phosphohistidine phosphatase
MDEPVRIYLVRHAIAADRGADYPDDSRRPLTPKGVERFRECVAGFVATGAQLEEILTSPYVRTRQTAELLAEAFERRPKITNMHALAVEGNPVEAIDTLARYTRRRHLALVGHMPSIGELAAKLAGQKRPLDFRKGAIACVEVEALPLPGPGELRWFLPPRLLRRLKTE